MPPSHHLLTQWPRRNIYAYRQQVVNIAPANLIAYWPLDEPSGTTIIDRSGAGRNGAYTATTLGVAGIGDSRTAARMDGSTSFGNLFSASLAAAFNGAEGTMAVWIKMSAAGVWTDGAAREILYLTADTNNRVLFVKAASNNEVDWFYIAGATSKAGGVTSFSPTGYFHLALTWSKAGDAAKFYLNGAQSGATATGLGTFAGSLAATTTLLGAISNTPTQVHSGDLAHVAIWTTPLSAAQIAKLYAVI